MVTEPLPRPDARLIAVEFDRLPVSVPEGTTVLRAAELAGVYIPSLCSHKELSPFGGCRLCTVEIAGMRGYPLACSTPAEDGMQVTTDTVTLREMRSEILRLILSQHPSSCLICDESDECARSLATIRKSGVSTGCRSCPNDGGCELQDVVGHVGIGDIGYPVSYRGLEAEHDDPFYDRDYNLCILCGRCVRMCHEVRGASVLAFIHRGPRTLIGPAFGGSHIAAGCEFCGACVSVCPTGALADKVSKWDGVADAVTTSTCPFCSLGCRVEIGHRDGRLSWARGAFDTDINDGQLCVRGRFCMPEATHHHDRARKPMLRRGAYFRVADWDEALTAVADRLSGVAPADILTVVSSDLSNEGLYAAQRFVREALGSPNLDSTAAACLPGGPALWSRLFSLPISMKALGEADTVIAAGLDSRFSFSVVGVQARRAVRRGATLVAVDARDSNLARAADEWIRAAAGDEARALIEVLRRHDGKGKLAVVVAPRVFDCPAAADLVAELETIARRKGVTVIPLVHGANVRGALELGALPGVLPGPRPAAAGGLTLADAWSGRPPRVIYLVGESPFTSRPDCEFVIAQDLYLPAFEVDAFLPAASFAEAEGTITNIEGRVQELARIEGFPADAVHGFSLPDWRIFSDLAARMGRGGLKYADAAAVRKAIRAEVRGFPRGGDRRPRRMTPMPAPAAERARRDGDDLAGSGRFVLVPERASFRHRGIDLAWVGAGHPPLHHQEGLHMCPDDMEGLGVTVGDPVTVTIDGLKLVLPARPDGDCSRGAVYVSVFDTWGGDAAPPALVELARRPARPLRVRVVAGDRSRPARIKAAKATPATRPASPKKPAKAAAKTGDRAGKEGGGRGRGR
jgi:predicted molibdopterin-dependent oxidoreductase YjgC